MKLREAAQQALEVLESVEPWAVVDHDPFAAAISALRAALAEDRYVVTGNEFHGAPPASYANWGDAIAAMIDSGVIHGLRISALAEREACAKVCDERERANLYGVKECAAAIRARGNK